MKKLMIAAAVAAVAGATFADVSSANTVGYISYGFDDANEVYEQNVGLCLTEFANGGDLVITDTVCGRTAEDGDIVSIFNIDYETSETYGFVDGGGWYKTVITFDDVVYDSVESFTIPAGTTFNFIPYDPVGSISQSGEVAASGTQTLTFQMDEANEIYSFPVVNPFPIATTLADLATFANVDGDLIRVYNTEYGTYDSYGYTEGAESDSWYKTVITFDGVDYTDIAESDWATTTVLEPGQGAIFTPYDETERTWNVTYNYDN